MTLPTAAFAQGLEQLGLRLELLIRLHLDPLVCDRIDVPGVVRRTQQQAWRRRGPSEGDAPDAQGAWLRRLLADNLSAALADLYPGPRCPRREMELEKSWGSPKFRFRWAWGMVRGAPSRRMVRAAAGCGGAGR